MFLCGEDDPAGASEVCDVARRELLLLCSHVQGQKYSRVLGSGELWRKRVRYLQSWHMVEET